MSNKHAYLIMVHQESYVLENLIKLIDDSRNDIFIHVDKKVKKFNFNYFSKIPQKSKIYFTDRIKVYWGGYSQIKCELLLLESAKEKGKYKYYHLLSRSDLPIKTQSEIYSFFLKTQGRNSLN